MRALNFEQSNVNLAENQPEYNTLPAYFGKLGTEENETGFVACFEVNDEDLEKIAAFRKIWYTQLTFGGKFQPMNLFVENDIFDLRPLDEQPQPEQSLFSVKQMVEFGNYLLSEERKARIENPENVNSVTDADLANFIEKLKSGK